MNTNLFASAACNSSTNFSCKGWEQLVYDPQEGQAYFEFSLINYAGSCPAPFSNSYVVPGSNPPVPVCFFNSSAVTVPGQPASALASMQMVGTTSGGTDTLEMFVNNVPYVVSQPSVLGLASGWNDVEFNIVGEDNGTWASFNSPTTIEVQVLTETTTNARPAPSCPQAGTTGEANTLSLIGNCCAWGGSQPGIQFLESNGSPAAQVCPTLAATPSPVSIPAGSQGYTTISVVGNPSGWSSNAALQPTSCVVTGQVPAWQNTSVQGQEFFFTVPDTATPGSVLTDTATCDNGMQVSIPIAVGSPIFTASPNPLVVTQGSCGDFTASVAPSSGVPANLISVTQNGLPAGANLSQIGTTVDNSATFSVCPTLSATPGWYNLGLTSYGNDTQETNTASTWVDIKACQAIPESQACTSGQYQACGQRSGGCGVEYNCPQCAGSTSCSNGVCCPAGEVGSDGYCCPTGQVYYGGLGCMAPCPTGTIPCPIGGGCMTELQCSRANNGPQPPNCALHHTCM
jgi:hypothetical protein